MKKEIDGDLAELIGIHIGDGCISVTERYKEYYLGGDLKEEKEYHDNWVSHLFNKKIASSIINKKIKYKEYPSTGIYGFYIFNPLIVDFFNKLGIKSGSKKNIQIPSKIRSNLSLAKRFLRGLFDTDGNIYFDKNRSAKFPKNDRPNIKLGTVSKKLSDQVFNLLIKLGFHPRKKKPYRGKKDKNAVHTILIYRKKDIERYIKEIGFKNPKHFTKWKVFKKIGICPPKTTLKQRKKILNNKIYKVS